MVSNVFAALMFFCFCVAVAAIVALLILRRQPAAPAVAPLPQAAPPQVAPLPPTAYLPQSARPLDTPSPMAREARRARDRLHERDVEAQEQIARQLARNGEFLEQIARQLATHNARGRGIAPPLPEAATRKTEAIEGFASPVAPRIDITELPPVPGSRTTMPPEWAKTDTSMPTYPSDSRRNGAR